MPPRSIITGFGLDLLTLLLQSLLIAINYNNSQSIFSRTLLPWLPKTCSIPILVLRLTSDLRLYHLLISRWTHRKHIRCPAMDKCESHRKHLFIYCCIYFALHSNGYISRPRNVISDPLPSNGHGADHIENTSCNTFSIIACAYFGRRLEMGLHDTIYCDVLRHWKHTSNYQLIYIVTLTII
jgi:hypothetical protein